MVVLMFSELIKLNIDGDREYFIDYMKGETSLKVYSQQVIFLNEENSISYFQIFNLN